MAEQEMILIKKAKCLFSVALLMHWTGQISEAEKLQAEARALLFRVKQKKLVAFFNPSIEHVMVAFDAAVASMDYQMGNYQAAEEGLRSLERVASRRTFERIGASLKLPFHCAAEYRLMLCTIQIMRGKVGMAEEVLKCLPHVPKEYEYFVWHTAGVAEFCDGRFDRARDYFQMLGNGRKD
ncbi:hypothetical protein H0H92_005908 [Tricholoma furcatifolium]|nr:hypothetical protein H0H92_005908 [Tricholoma furcatifolium]